MILKRTAPQIIVKDVTKSVTFYCNELNFKVDWINKQNPLFAIIHRDNFSLMLRQLENESYVRPNKIPFLKSINHIEAEECWDIYIWIENAEELYDEFKRKDIKIIKHLTNTTYGNKDFVIEDLDGYIMCFGQEVD